MHEGRGGCRGPRRSDTIRSRTLEAEADLVRPIALETGEHLVQTTEIICRNLSHSLHRAELALIELADDLRGRPALGRERDADAAPVGLATLVVDVAELDELLQVVGNVRAQVEPAALKLARG